MLTKLTDIKSEEGREVWVDLNDLMIMQYQPAEKESTIIKLSQRTEGVTVLVFRNSPHVVNVRETPEQISNIMQDQLARAIEC